LYPNSIISFGILSSSLTESPRGGRIKQEVTQTAKLKIVATLASGIAHEIKNPLTAIKTFTEFLPQKLDDKQFLEKFSHLVGQEVERIDRLVHQLLEFAKPRPLTLICVNVDELVEDTLNLLSNRFLKQKINVEKEFFKEQDGTLYVDPNQFRQALLNIFLNAIEAMPNGGTLRVSAKFNNISNVSQNRSYFHVVIEDTGYGIDPQDLPHIFDPFFSKKDGGTGLGLSITHGIIKEHGGKIRAESQIGVGTKFIIELPLREEEESPKEN